MIINYYNLIKVGIMAFLLYIVGYIAIYHLFPFTIAIAIAIMINPIVNLLQYKLHINRRLAVLSVLLFILVSFITLISFSIIEFIHLLQYLSTKLPNFVEDLFSNVESFTIDKIDQLYHFITAYINSIHPDSQTMIKDMFKDMTNSIKEMSKNALIGFIQDTITWLSTILKSSYYLIFILIGTFFISSDGPKWKKYILNKLPISYTQFYDSAKYEFISLVKRYISAQLIIVLITGITVLVGLMLLQVPHAFAVAMVAMLFDLVPLIGISALFIPWILYLFFTSNFILTVKISILFLLLVVMRNLLEPKLLGSSIGVHPLALLIILFIFIKAFGFIGFILGPVAAVSLKALMKAGTFRIIGDYIFRAN